MTMRVLAAVLAAVVVASAASHGQSQDQAQDNVFRSTTESVVVDVSVQQRGRPVPDLRAADFELKDNGAVQTLSDLSHEALPIDVTLVVDVSGSVQGLLLGSLRRALVAVGAQLRPTDRAKVVTFNHRVHEASGFAEGRLPPMPQALERPMGHTSVLDAIALSVIAAPASGRRSMAIVFTDGADTVSVLDGSQLLAAASRSGLAIFVVAIASPAVPRSAQEPPPHQGLFEDLAEATGGDFVALQQGQELGPAFVRAFNAFRSSYVLRYSPTTQSAGWHAVSVRVTRPGSYDIRARPGYQR
jgi:VWFA-related protein